MTLRRNNIILLVFFLQLLMPLACIALVCTVLTRGQEVTVPMAAYDPYDIIRGRYLQISNPDSEVPIEPGLEKELENIWDAGSGFPDMYVVLQPDPDTGLSRFSFATLKRPEHGTPYITCPASTYFIKKRNDGTSLRIYPRIDKYYLNEADALYLDQNIRQDTDIRVILKLWNGMYAIDGIEVDGVPY